MTSTTWSICDPTRHENTLRSLSPISKDPLPGRRSAASSSYSAQSSARPSPSQPTAYRQHQIKRPKTAAQTSSQQPPPASSPAPSSPARSEYSSAEEPHARPTRHGKKHVGQACKMMSWPKIKEGLSPPVVKAPNSCSPSANPEWRPPGHFARFLWPENNVDSRQPQKQRKSQERASLAVTRKRSIEWQH